MTGKRAVQDAHFGRRADGCQEGLRSRPRRIHSRMRAELLKSILLPLFAGSLFAQQAGPDPLLRWMDGIAQGQLQLRETAIAGIHNVADADRREQWGRQTFLSILGGLPEYSGPLNPRITGQIE